MTPPNEDPPDGKKWMAGGTTVAESMGQQLASPLTPGQAYDVSAFLVQDDLSTRDSPGGYDVLLSDAGNLNGTIVKVATLGSTGPTDHVWELFTDSFVAPANAGSLDWFILRPFTDDFAAYPGIDDVTLRAVPEPSMLAALSGLLGMGVIGRWWRRRGR